MRQIINVFSFSMDTFFKQQQLESVSFQSSACAPTQANPNKLKLVNIKIDLSVLDAVFLFKNRCTNLDEYWDDNFEFVNDDLLPLSRFGILDVVDHSLVPPIELFRRGNSWHYNDGRHRHLRLLILSNCDPNFELVNGIHYKIRESGQEFDSLSNIKRANDFCPEGKENEMVKFVSKTGTNLFVLDLYKYSLIELHENDFKRRDLPCFKKGPWTVKYIGQRKEAQILVSKLLDSVYKSEVLESIVEFKNKFTDFLSGIGTIFEVIAGIGKVKNTTLSKYEQLKQNFLTPMLDNELVKGIKKYGLGILKVLVSVWKIVKDTTITMFNLSCLVLDIVSLYKEMDNYAPESLEHVLVAGISAVLPKKLVEILKNMTVLTSKKIFDDNGIVFEFFSLVSHLLDYIISYFPDSVREYLQSVLDMFGMTEFLFIRKSQIILTKYNKNKHIMLNISFRNEVKSLYDDIHKINLKRFFSKNKPLSDVASEFERIYKAVISYEQTSRQEPCCFVFQGPPGCRKSVTVNKVISTLGLTHYSHIVKCAEDSKDWYDSYNNEEIFYMDDVGQMGKSQWRNLINWVSAVKLPLDCAEASLKDTKYFNSEIILLTTNNFTDLQGFTASDCIETPDALWRRGYVFDMQRVKGEGNDMKGVAQFKYFDIKVNKFLSKFPPDFEEFLSDNNVQLDTYCDVGDQNNFLSWLTTIIMGFRKMKKEQLENNTLEDKDIKLIRASNPFYSEGKFDDFKECLNDYFEYVLDVSKQILSDCVTMFTSNPKIACGSLLVSLSVATLLYKFKELYNNEGAFLTKSDIKNRNDDFVDKFDTVDLCKAHSMLPKIASQMFEVDMVFSERGISKIVSCHSLISGRKLLLPYHLVLDRELQVVVYKNRAKGHRIIDHSPVKLLYKNVENDVAIVSLSEGFPSPFPKLSSSFLDFDREVPVGLVFPFKIVKIEGILVNRDDAGPVIYPVGAINNEVKNPLIYRDLHFPGMCGTLVVTNQGHIIGMHVAGNDNKSLGASLVWSKSCRSDLFNVFDSIDSGLKITTPMSSKDYADCSGIKLDSELSVYVPKNSNFVKSPLYGCFEISRQPANLSVYGPHTVKDVSKSSRLHIGPVQLDELNFASKLLELYFEDFDDLTEFEIVKGDEMLAPINKKSSNGIFPIKSKLDCFDFEKGEFKDEFRQLYNEFEAKITSGEVDIKDIAWFETLKDELRNIEKKEPRSFRVCPVTMQVLTKKCFGKLVKKIVKDRWFNEIMIGLNPFTEWPKLYQRMQGGRCWGGDIGKYDKCMRVQVQEMVANKILQFYKGNLKQAATNILMNIAYNVVVVNDDSWILTHSLPSGCWLTAIFNSLVNRVYTAMWYYRELVNNGKKPNHLNFHLDISDPVYGDDRLNRCINPEYASFLNALTMEKFFNSLGMDMTDSLKNKIQTPFQPVEELTFLKRYFRFHPKLNKIVCPLDLRTVYSSLSWLDSSKEDLDVVLRDKINAFQREIFLHYDIYERDILKLEDRCINENISFSLLPESYLIKLYESGGYDDFYSSAFGILNC